VRCVDRGKSRFEADERPTGHRVSAETETPTSKPANCGLGEFSFDQGDAFWRIEIGKDPHSSPFE
jgi:hypothetical protein